MRRGFTMLEALVVVAMMGIVALMAAPFLSGSLSGKDLESSGNEAVDLLREAQISAMSGRNNARYGVHFQSDRFVLFEGAAYSVVDPKNIERLLDPEVSVTAVSLAPGGACTVATGVGNCDVHFNDRRGTSVEIGTIAFTDSAGTVRTVAINAVGMIEAN